MSSNVIYSQIDSMHQLYNKLVVELASTKRYNVLVKVVFIQQLIESIKINLDSDDIDDLLSIIETCALISLYLHEIALMDLNYYSDLLDKYPFKSIDFDPHSIDSYQKNTYSPLHECILYIKSIILEKFTDAHEYDEIIENALKIIDNICD